MLLLKPPLLLVKNTIQKWYLSIILNIKLLRSPIRWKRFLHKNRKTRENPDTNVHQYTEKGILLEVLWKR